MQPATITTAPRSWRPTRLAEVLLENDRTERVEGTKAYRLLGVRLAGQGPFLREEKLGSQTQASNFSQVRKGDFIYSRLFAWRGAFGVVSEELDGAYVSNEFPTFSVDRARLDVNFLRLYFSQPPIWSNVETFCTGTTKASRNRFKEEFFLGMEIALPPLDVQRRIVSRIEELTPKLEEARVFRRDAFTAAEKLVTAEAEACFRTLVAKHGTRKFSDFAPHVTSGPRNWGAYYSDSGVRFYRAQDISADFKIADGSKICVSKPANGQAEGAKLQPGDLMLVITGATVGRCAVFSSGGEAGLVNQHVALCRFPKESVVPEYVLWGLRSERGQEQLLGQRYGQGKPGLNLNNIRALELPFPSMNDQHRAVTHLDSFRAKVDSLKKLQSETAAELDALMPSILSKAFRGEL